MNAFDNALPVPGALPPNTHWLLTMLGVYPPRARPYSVCDLRYISENAPGTRRARPENGRVRNRAQNEQAVHAACMISDSTGTQRASTGHVHCGTLAMHGR